MSAVVARRHVDGWPLITFRPRSSSPEAEDHRSCRIARDASTPASIPSSPTARERVVPRSRVADLAGRTITGSTAFRARAATRSPRLLGRMDSGGDLFFSINEPLPAYATCYYAPRGHTSREARRDLQAATSGSTTIDRVRPGHHPTIASAWRRRKIRLFERTRWLALRCHGIGISHHEKRGSTRNCHSRNPVPIEAGMHFALETFCGEGEDGARIESQ